MTDYGGYLVLNREYSVKLTGLLIWICIYKDTGFNPSKKTYNFYYRLKVKIGFY